MDNADYAWLSAIVAVFLAIIITVGVNIHNTSNNNHKSSVECIKAGGNWKQGKVCQNG